MNRGSCGLILTLAAMMLVGCQHSNEISPRAKARNVILFVGGGMSTTTVVASRIRAGQLEGRSGEESRLSFEQFPHVGLSKTYNVDAQIADSAGTMTAMMTGVKTDAGLIGVGEASVRGDCESARDNALLSALQLAELAGMQTGVVTTARLTHATPAATFAVSPERDWESDADMPATAKAAGCIDIAAQFVDFESALESRIPGADIDGIEIALGGGRDKFASGGDRKDGRDLTREWQQAYPEGVYVTDRAALESIPALSSHVLGLFASSHLDYQAALSARSAAPSLSEMTRFAVERLSHSETGFLLIVEGGRIDHAHHAGNAYAALTETIELANAVSIADEMTQDEDTLIIVTADHSHTITMTGYPPRGNPILGKVPVPGREVPQMAFDQKPYTTLSYANGRGPYPSASAGSTNPDVRYREPVTMGRVDLSEVDTTAPGFHQEALVPLESETRAGDDVAIYAKGPGGALVRGVLEQHLIFHAINHSLDLVNRATEAVNESGVP